MIHLSAALFALILAFALLSYYEDRDLDYVVMGLAGLGLLLMLYSWWSHRGSPALGGPDILDRDPTNFTRASRMNEGVMARDAELFMDDLGRYA